ncbi:MULTISPECIES: hypothetical protein [unclassified Haloferax]|nr:MULTISPECIES: hypothetical protein [unclassified Haloferax]
MTLQEGDTIERRNSKGNLTEWTVVIVDESEDGTVVTLSGGGE